MGKAFLQQIRLGGDDEVRGRVFINLTFSVAIITPWFLLRVLKSLFLCFTSVSAPKVDTKVSPERPAGPVALLGPPPPPARLGVSVSTRVDRSCIATTSKACPHTDSDTHYVRITSTSFLSVTYRSGSTGENKADWFVGARLIIFNKYYL